MSEFVKFYDAPDGAQAWSYLFRGATKKTCEFRYEKNWYEAGSYTLVFPCGGDIFELAVLGGLICIDGDWLIAENIAYENDILTISGSDTKAILKQRVALWGSGDYDAFAGTTAQCIEHYVGSNCIDSETAARNIPMKFSAGDVTGLARDSYIAKYDNLHDIVRIFCENAGIGYDIEPDFSGVTAKKLKMTLRQGLDRSVEQSDRKRVIFSPKWGNVQSETFSHDISNYYNAVYAHCSAGNAFYTPEAQMPEGLSRRECAVEVGAESQADIVFYAQNAVKENIVYHNFSIVPTGQGLGVDYFLGDIVSVRDPYLGNTFTGRIESVKKTYSAGKKTVEIAIGSRKKKLLARIVNGLIDGTQGRR